ncbi:MAG: endonuclease III domain-containing protein [Gammaproteobacteria bacterium]|nr:MAG: endonuclease III domain-containing protein [Gammaproteobacteria bacterium]
MTRTAEDFSPGRARLMALYEDLLALYGAQSWWPADSPFEVAVGAILTQNTNWSNVERALERLKAAEALGCEAILAMDVARLAELIRPAGYYNLKAQRLRNLCRYLSEMGGLQGLRALSCAQAREGLLGVKGVGPETADDILLFALDRPVFVIDAYTRRLLRRQGLARGDEPYEVLRQGFEQALPADVRLFKEYHALIVEHAKRACRKRADCAVCGLSEHCLRLEVE